jgi:hypothetical protein
VIDNNVIVRLLKKVGLMKGHPADSFLFILLKVKIVKAVIPIVQLSDTIQRSIDNPI